MASQMTSVRTRRGLGIAARRSIATRPMKVTVIGGAGYVGVVTSVGLAHIGHEVVAVDVDQGRVALLQSGQSPIHEEGLQGLLRDCLGAGRIRFTTGLKDAVRQGEVIFIAVGTPTRDDGHADLSQVIQVAEHLAEYIDRYKVVVVKSTVPVGAVELVRSILSRRLVEGEHFDVVSNPEFLREGKGLVDFFHPDRIIIGTSSPRARTALRRLYAPILARRVKWHVLGATVDRERPVPLIETDLTSAQMIKYAANAFLAMRISFINEIAGLCERVHADVREVSRGLGHDVRIGLAYLEAGLGFGGPCLEKDLRALLRIAAEVQYEPRLLRATLERNELQVREALNHIKQMTGYLLYKRIVAIFGLAFKSGTSDVRNSRALRLIQELLAEGAIVQAYDPIAVAAAKTAQPNAIYFDDPLKAARNAEILVIATDWREFRNLDFAALRTRMAQPRILDARNLLDGRQLAALGFQYKGIGTP